MKIAYINSFYAPDEVGGAEKSVRFLAETMVQRGHQATVITLGRTRETAQLNGVAIERLPIANLYFPADAGGKAGWQKMLWHGIDSYNLSAAQQVGRVLDTVRPDVVHTNNLAGFSVATWRAINARRIPIVHTLRDYYLLCANTAMFKNGHPCEGRCTSCTVLSQPRGRATPSVQHVVGNSHFILNKHLKEGLFKGVPGGAIYNAYQPVALENHRATDRVTFGFIGRLAPSKGLEFLIQAMRAIPGQPAHELIVAGEGEPQYIEQLKALAQGLPVRFLGRVKAEDFYARVHWTIVPSLWDEPLARVLFESFAHGVPVIGSATGGTPELIRHGENGHLFTTESPAQLTPLLQEAIACGPQAYARLSAQASLDGQNFVPKNVADQYSSIYQKLCLPVTTDSPGFTTGA
jgi:glycosyltransferase involved in cell wall biosynthesis